MEGGLKKTEKGESVCKGWMALKKKTKKKKKKKKKKKQHPTHNKNKKKKKKEAGPCVREQEDGYGGKS